MQPHSIGLSTCLQVGPQAALFGIECDVSSPGAVQRLTNAASSQLGSIDVWINNAGYSGRYQVGCSNPIAPWGDSAL